MNRKSLFLGAIILTVVAIVLAIYYALPGVNHVFVSGAHAPTSPQPSHIVLFVILAVLGVIVALVNRPISNK